MVTVMLEINVDDARVIFGSMWCQSLSYVLIVLVSVMLAASILTHNRIGSKRTLIVFIILIF